MTEIRETILTTKELTDLAIERNWVSEPDHSYSNRYGIKIARPCRRLARELLK